MDGVTLRVRESGRESKLEGREEIEGSEERDEVIEGEPRREGKDHFCLCWSPRTARSSAIRLVNG